MNFMGEKRLLYTYSMAKLHSSCRYSLDMGADAGCRRTGCTCVEGKKPSHIMHCRMDTHCFSVEFVCILSDRVSVTWKLDNLYVQHVLPAPKGLVML
jgi:hypothetical protein